MSPLLWKLVETKVKGTVLLSDQDIQAIGSLCLAGHVAYLFDFMAEV